MDEAKRSGGDNNAAVASTPDQPDEQHVETATTENGGGGASASPTHQVFKMKPVEADGRSDEEVPAGSSEESPKVTNDSVAKGLVTEGPRTNGIPLNEPTDEALIAEDKIAAALAEGDKQTVDNDLADMLEQDEFEDNITFWERVLNTPSRELMTTVAGYMYQTETAQTRIVFLHENLLRLKSAKEMLMKQMPLQVQLQPAEKKKGKKPAQPEVAVNPELTKKMEGIDMEIINMENTLLVEGGSLVRDVLFTFSSLRPHVIYALYHFTILRKFHDLPTTSEPDKLMLQHIYSVLKHSILVGVAMKWDKANAEAWGKNIVLMGQYSTVSFAQIKKDYPLDKVTLKNFINCFQTFVSLQALMHSFIQFINCLASTRMEQFVQSVTVVRQQMNMLFSPLQRVDPVSGTTMHVQCEYSKIMSSLCSQVVMAAKEASLVEAAATAASGAEEGEKKKKAGAPVNPARFSMLIIEAANNKYTELVQ